MDLFIVILYAVNVFQSLGLGIILLLIARRDTGKARRLLGILFLFITLYFSYNLLYALRLLDIIINIYLPTLPVILVIIPLFYLYLENVTHGRRSLKKGDWYHFIPAISILVLNLPYFFATPEDRLFFISRSFAHQQESPLIRYLLLVYGLGVYVIFILQMGYYSIRSYRVIRHYKQFIMNHLSYREHVDTRWIKTIAILFMAFFTMNEFLHFQGVVDLPVTRIFYTVSMVVITFFIGYHGITQKELLLEEVNEGQPQPDQVVKKEPENVKPKYQGSALTEEGKFRLIKEIDQLMEKEKVFKESKLSVEDLAIRLKTNAKYVSQVLNELYGKNFYSFINHYRIKEAILLMEQDKSHKFSIIGIAQLAGFTSKSSFNEVFRNITGMTPSEYRRRIKERSGQPDTLMNLNRVKGLKPDQP